MSDSTYNVLFLCTANSARSILAEALLNQLAKGRMRAYSAGSYPRGQVHPQALATLARLGLSTEGYRSKSWDEFAAPDAPEFDFIFTVCDNAAGETCPLWPGKPISAHWGIPDPAAVTDSETAQQQAFLQASEHLRRRIELFLALPFLSLDTVSLQHQLRAIGQS